MISSFWDICRACPSMPLEKFHSEYRSTFQWHEHSSIEPAGTQSANLSTTVVQQQPAKRNRNLESSLTEISGEPPIPRRKKNPELAYRTNEWIAKTSDKSNKSQVTNSEVRQEILRPKKSISMGTIPGYAAGLKSHRLHAAIQEKPSRERAIDEGESSFTLEAREDAELTRSLPPHIHDIVERHDMENEKNKNDAQGEQNDVKRKECKSEYKERFRPFSQYEYVDGRFLNKRADHEADRPWYAEVVELRKKAGEYKFRGWGTDLCSPSALNMLNQQLWEQVSRRSSLAPLALIAATPRHDVSKVVEKDKENTRKGFAARGAIGRPHTATPKHPISDLEKYKGEAVQPSKKKLLDESNSTKKMFPKMKATSRSQSAGPTNRSPRKSTRQQSAASSVSEKDNISGWKVQDNAIDARCKPPARQLRPTSLYSVSPRHRAASGKRNRDAKVKLANQQLFNKNSANSSMGYGDSVVKSPPEPTRMKSPEQALVRSPDPVNWTVPLDTTKGFTVTQNIKEAPPSPRKLPGGGSETKSAKPSVNGFERSLKGSKRAEVDASPRGVKITGPSKKSPADQKKAAKIDSKGDSITTETEAKVAAPIKCLEDPTFMFDAKKSTTDSTAIPQTQQPIVKSKGMVVLEAPTEVTPTIKTTEGGIAFTPPAPVASSKSSLGGSKLSGTPPKSKKGGINILEAPTDTQGHSKSGLASRSKASDVLEKARHKFDKFWGKSKDESKDDK